MCGTEEDNFRIVVGHEKIHRIFTTKFISFFLLYQLEQPGAFSEWGVQINQLRKVSEIFNF